MILVSCWERKSLPQNYEIIFLNSLLRFYHFYVLHLIFTSIFFFFLMWLVLLLLCSPKGHIRNVRILFRLSPWLRKRCWYSMVRSQGCLPDSFRTQNFPQQRIPEFYLTLKCPTRSLYLTIAFCQQQSETKHLRSINKNGKGFNPLLLKLTVFKNNNTWVFGEILNVMYQGEFVD